MLKCGSYRPTLSTCCSDSTSRTYVSRAPPAVLDHIHATTRRANGSLVQSIGLTHTHMVPPPPPPCHGPQLYRHSYYAQYSVFVLSTNASFPVTLTNDIRMIQWSPDSSSLVRALLTMAANTPLPHPAHFVAARVIASRLTPDRCTCKTTTSSTARSMPMASVLRWP